MPTGKKTVAKEICERMKTVDLTGIVPEESSKSKTGYVNVIELKNGKFQARLQVPGDGRGGEKKRKQYPMPGNFDTALEAALYMAYIKKGMKAANDGRLIIPYSYKPRTKPPTAKPAPPAKAPPVGLAAQMPHTPMATAHAIPIPSPMLHAPLVAISPLPMQPLGYTPPF
jgi:hypothetical protein